MGTKSSVTPTYPHAHTYGKHTSRVFVLRQLLSLCLLCVAVVLSLTTYFMMRQQEENLANSQYDSVARSAISMVQKPVARSLYGSTFIAMQLKSSFPDIQSWPNVILPIDESWKITGTSSVFFAPIVQPEQLAAFESFAFNYWDSDPLTAAGGYYSAGQRGVWSMASTGLPYHDTTGDSWPPEEKVLAPILQVSPMENSTSSVGYSLLGYNGYSLSASTAKLLRGQLQCVQQYPVDFSQCSSTFSVHMPIPSIESPTIAVTGVNLYSAVPVTLQTGDTSQ
ncbi:hypothetical protein B484DRAFT_438951, partial [Ochromonadaceae sp. CCMP2298]